MPRKEIVGPEAAPLGGVVVDDVEDDLDAGGVERLHHRFELGDLAARVAGAGIAGVGGEEIDRVVSPIVPQPLVDQMFVVEKSMDRHQLDRGRAQLDEMLDRGGVSEAGVRPLNVGRHVRMPLGEALDVGLIDDRTVQRSARGTVIAPIERGVDYDSLGNSPSVVLRIYRQVRGFFAGELISEDRHGPIDLAGQRARIRVDEELGWVEAIAVIGVLRSRHTIAVALSWADSRQKNMPDKGVDVAQLHLCLGARLVEQTEGDSGRGLAEEREVGSADRSNGRPVGKASPEVFSTQQYSPERHYSLAAPSAIRTPCAGTVSG